MLTSFRAYKHWHLITYSTSSKANLFWFDGHLSFYFFHRSMLKRHFSIPSRASSFNWPSKSVNFIIKSRPGNLWIWLLKSLKRKTHSTSGQPLQRSLDSCRNVSRAAKSLVKDQLVPASWVIAKTEEYIDCCITKLRNSTHFNPWSGVLKIFSFREASIANPDEEYKSSTASYIAEYFQRPSNTCGL